MFGGADNLLKIYKIATPKRYDFLHLDLQENPPIAYHNFEKKIAVGSNIINDNRNLDLKNEDPVEEEIIEEDD